MAASRRDRAWAADPFCCRATTSPAADSTPMTAARAASAISGRSAEDAAGMTTPTARALAAACHTAIQPPDRVRAICAAS